MNHGGRLSAGARIGRVRLQVADLDRSVRFYGDGIGLHAIDRSDGVARLGPPNGPVLLELHERPGIRPVPRTGLLGIYHFALLLPSRADLGRFVRHHAREGTPFGAADHAFSEALYLEDPDGITIEVYTDRPEEEWPVRRDGRLPLVSDPLDAAGLMAVAGDGDWHGVPARSTIGHMHFFVDDLEAAEAFYVRGVGFDRMISVPSALFVSAGGYHHHVGLNTWRAGAPQAGEEDAGLLDWELVAPAHETVEAVERLTGAGFDVRPAGAGGVARDPWGIVVRFTPES